MVHGWTAMRWAAGKGRKREVGDPAKGVSLWARPGSIGALGVGCVAMAKVKVALGAVALGSLTHRGSMRAES